MQLTILGSSGSLAGPDNAASGYYVESVDAAGVIMDLGPGALAQLQRHADPAGAHIMFSHLHPDHCLDFPSLLVWRRYHPEYAARTRHLMFGPQAAPTHLGRLSSDAIPEGINDLADTFDFGAWEPRRTEHIEGLSVTPYPMVHPVEAYALRVVEESTGETLVYSGDTAWTENLVEAARGADLFLCEANWGATSQGKVAGMHLSGREAGRAAQQAGVRRLVIIHVPPWLDPEESVAAARLEFDGPVEFGRPGARYQVGGGAPGSL